MMKIVPPIRFLVLVLMVLLAYVPAYRECGFIWDDDSYVFDNSMLRSTLGLREIWFRPGATPQYYPLVFTTFWLEYHLWGLWPAGYHLVNVFLHGLNSGLLWLLLRRLNVAGAWFAAAVFALHPVHVESVAWVTERKNVLSGFFCLLSFLAYLRFAPPEQPSGGKLAWRWYAAALLLFALALFSKTITCSLPAVLVLVYWWKQEGQGRAPGRLLALVPMFVLGALLARQTSYLETHFVGAEGEDFAFTFTERCLIAGRALCFYAGKLFWPYPLMFTYPRWHIDAADPWQYLYPAAVIMFFAVLAWLTFRPAGKSWQPGRGPLTACLIFVGTLLPALGFFNVYPMIFSFVADHFQYLPSIALIALSVAAVHRLAESRRWLQTRTASGLAGSLLIVLGSLTFKQCGIYRDVSTLFLDTLAQNPDAWMANSNLGAIKRKDMSRLPADSENFHFVAGQALRYLDRAVALNPRARMAYLNRGLVFMELRKYPQAEDDLLSALRVENETLPLYKHDAGICRDMATLQEKLKKDEVALHYLLQAVAVGEAKKVWFRDTGFDQDPHSDPRFGKLQYETGELLKKLGRTQEAETMFETAITTFRRALDEVKAAGQESQQEGAEAHFNLGYVMFQMGRNLDALPHLQRAVRIKPDVPIYRNTLATLESRL